MNISLQGKTALVSGSSKGIGLAVAQQLAAQGASIILLARNEEQLKLAISTLSSQSGSTHSYYVADFSSIDAVKKVVEQIKTAQKKIQILINNTGGPPGGPIVQAALEEFTQAFNNHLLCNHLLTQSFINDMKESNYGRIINIISTSVKIPLHGLGVSNTIRAAVANWSKTMANELASFGITVNNVLPGATATDRLQNIIEQKSEKAGKKIEEISHEMVAEIPMKRFGESSEIAAAVGFLASPAASYITGINLPVDGGRTGSL